MKCPIQNSFTPDSIEKITSGHKILPSLLIHSCCAPCSSSVLEYLSQHFLITVFYFNPNINSEKEYVYRRDEQKRFINEFADETHIINDTSVKINPIKFIDGGYNPKLFYEAAKGLENEPERGKRCLKCFELRLRETAAYASKNKFDYFTTTLTLSPLKDAQAINEIGNMLGTEYGVTYLPSNFKKNDGYKRSIELSKKYNLYRQNYCGCVFSMRKDDETKNLKA